MAEIASPWFTVSEAAKYAKVGEDTITRWLNEGRIKPAMTRTKKNPKGPGRAGYLIEQSDLDAFLRSLKASVADAVAELPVETPKPQRKRPAPASTGSTSELLKRDGF